MKPDLNIADVLPVLQEISDLYYRHDRMHFYLVASDEYAINHGPAALP